MFLSLQRKTLENLNSFFQTYHPYKFTQKIWNHINHFCMCVTELPFSTYMHALMMAWRCQLDFQSRRQSIFVLFKWNTPNSMERRQSLSVGKTSQLLRPTICSWWLIVVVVAIAIALYFPLQPLCRSVVFRKCGCCYSSFFIRTAIRL